MNRLLVFLLLFTAACTNDKNETKPYFIGTLQYDYTYTSNELNVDSLREQRPGKAIFRFDTLNYQSQFIGKDTFTYYYSGALNKAASRTNQMDEGCEDYSQPTDSILSFKIYDTDEKVLGYACRILEFQSKIFYTRYYISKELKIAPATYKKHLAYNWSFYGKKTEGGLILKLEHRFKRFTMSGIARYVDPMNKDFRALEIDDTTLKHICNVE
jgi:hypothetical protein